MRGGWTLVPLLAVAFVAAADQRPEGTPASRAALAACTRVRDAPEADQERLYGEVLAEAERAVAADDGDALAHFAVFCSLGGRMQRQGISLAALSNLRRLRREIDRTLALAPDYADALAGKGSLLCETPWLLGGDPAAGEVLLRRAIVLDPEWVRPRLTLAEALLARGERAEAATVAREALALAEREQDAEKVVDARALLERAGAGEPAPTPAAR
jgi:hypothetical protein